jgi:CRISPR/Cas system CSM-associated protein Csm3 (group 7 of RAMP superfamily)
MSNGKGTIRERIYVQGILKAVSPLVVGCGEERQTDIDLIRDAEGIPFIPGTSLAGSSRQFLNNLLEEADRNVVYTVFGRKEKQSIQSLVSFFDALPVNGKPLMESVRDGIRLVYETKTVGTHQHRDKKSGGAKYDYEIVETDAEFTFRLEMAVRDSDSIFQNLEKEKIYDLLYQLLVSLQNERVRVGAKTRRGFGKIRLENVNILHLDMENPGDVQRWIEFDRAFASTPDTLDVSHFKTDKLLIKKETDIRITAEFKIPYSILIRHYGTDPGDADASHLMSGENAVIPGTSWNGAVSHAIYNILEEMDYETLWQKEIKNDLFGTEKGKDARASRIAFEESVIHKRISITNYTRNKVDRFTGGVVDSALFDEKPVFGGTTSLCITIKNAEPWEAGLILLALRDLGNGIHTVGGDANIGRGILQCQRITIDKEPLTLDSEKEKYYFKALYSFLNKKKGENHDRCK